MNSTWPVTATYTTRMANSSDALYNSSDDNIDPYPALRELVYQAHIYIAPVIIGIGLVGNVVTMVLFFSSYMRKISMSIYLSALAISDSLFLLTLIIIWLEYVDVQLFHMNGFCQGTIFLSYCSSFLSSWFVVSVTVERYIAICFPLKRKAMCTVRRARWVVIAISTTAVFVYSVTLWIEGIDSVVFADYKYTLCTTLKQYQSIHVILTYADTAITLIVPYTIILIINSFLIFKITRLRNQHMSLTQYSLRVLTENSESRGDSGHEISVSSCIYSRAQLQITRMLLTMSSVFLVINTPSYSMRLYVFFRSFGDYMDNAAENVDPQSELFMLIQQLFQLLYYTNYAINFWIYSVSSPNFRRIFWRSITDMKEKIVKWFRSLRFVDREIISEP